ncbi:MAG: hypothetical protein AVDCRST_MAG18-5262, partial [uncultured Thermomicrobiales bacterium]
VRLATPGSVHPVPHVRTRGHVDAPPMPSVLPPKGRGHPHHPRGRARRSGFLACAESRL